MIYWNQELPESDLPKSQTVYWMYPDDEPGFFKNQPDGYTSTSITYRMNSNGYRGAEFDEPANFKILVGGCSHTFGIGINEEDLWCNQFAQHITGSKIYNLALGGRSPDYVVRSLYKSIDIIKPNLVLVMWPEQSRFERPTQDGMGMTWWSVNDTHYPSEFADEHYQNYNFEKNQLFLEHLCAARNIPLVAMRYSELTQRIQKIDLARDTMHDGPIWNLRAANEYWQAFQKLF